MSSPNDIVITGLGVVSPIGMGRQAFWSSMVAGSSGIRPLTSFDASGLAVQFGGQIVDFDPKLAVRPRKSLKVMSRDIQLGFAATDLAIADAGLVPGAVAPERFGIVFGSDMIYADIEDLEGTYRRSVVDGRFDYSRWAEAIQQEVHPLWLLQAPAQHDGVARGDRPRRPRPPTTRSSSATSQDFWRSLRRRASSAAAGPM